jgi:dethiobiotin synthetase
MKNSKKRFFVTGTDTDAGKTYVTVGLLMAAARRDIKSFGLKPIAAGAAQVDDELVNDDALMIQKASSVNMHYSQVNPIVFEPAIAPHIAAQRESKLITVSRLDGFIKGSLLTPHDFALIEGAGGWKVPLNDRELMSDLAKSLGLPVILVVNMKLGCINHTLLTIESIKNDGLALSGWIANSAQGAMSCYKENLQTLKALVDAPFLGELDYYQTYESSDARFDLILDAVLS